MEKSKGITGGDEVKANDGLIIVKEKDEIEVGIRELRRIKIRGFINFLLNQ